MRENILIALYDMIIIRLYYRFLLIKQTEKISQKKDLGRTFQISLSKNYRTKKRSEFTDIHHVNNCINQWFLTIGSWRPTKPGPD